MEKEGRGERSNNGDGKVENVERRKLEVEEE